MKTTIGDVTLLFGALFACAVVQQVFGLATNDTCGLDELNHSVLVECNECSRIASGPDGGESIWPANKGDILHLKSTRAGKRFSQRELLNLNHKLDEHARLFDINTTLIVKSANTYKPDIIGLGATLHMADLASALEDGSFKRLYGRLFNDLYGSSSSDAQMSVLRLRADPNLMSEHNVTGLFLHLDNEITHLRANKTGPSALKMIVHPRSGFNDLTLLARTLVQASGSMVGVNLWALAVEHDKLKKKEEWLSLREILPARCRLLAYVPLSEAPSLLQWNRANGAPLHGFLIKSEESVAYDVLDWLVTQTDRNFTLIAVGRARQVSKLYGDWFNAHEYAIEVLNHLKHGANGFIERCTVADLQDKFARQATDCPIYGLLASHNTHFKGPMHYATGHFSRYLTASRPLDYELFTQPNMFSAHYAAFMTLDERHIISMVLNGNEHNQLFSWVIDDTIVANTLLEPKSFNTFIMKI